MVLPLLLSSKGILKKKKNIQNSSFARCLNISSEKQVFSVQFP